MTDGGAFSIGTIRSDLSGPFLEGGYACFVNIAKLHTDHWKLILTTAEGDMIHLREDFETDRAAWDHFLELVEAAGMEAIATGHPDLVAASTAIARKPNGP